MRNAKRKSKDELMGYAATFRMEYSLLNRLREFSEKNDIPQSEIFRKGIELFMKQHGERNGK